MSFSSETKKEMCSLKLRHRGCAAAELFGLIKGGGVMRIQDRQAMVVLNSDNADVAQRMTDMVKHVLGVDAARYKRDAGHINAQVYETVIEQDEAVRALWNLYGNGAEGVLDAGTYVGGLERKCCKRSILRGLFLSCGTVTAPEKSYRLDFVHEDAELLELANNLLREFEIPGKIILRKQRYVLYLKEGEAVVNFLALLGAVNSLLSFENTRILKQMRNQLNRSVNCEMANLGKTVNAAARQIENIRYTIEHMGMDYLPEPLREIAQVRIKYPEASLQELSDVLSFPLGRSGVNHRLRKLDEIGRELREEKGDM